MATVGMASWRTFCLVFGYLALVTSGDSNTTRKSERASGAAWGYEPYNGPSTWGGVCRTGLRQSPINIQLGKAVVKNFPPFTFEGDYLRRLRLYAKNNGHTVYVAPENPTVEPVVHGGGLGAKFVFEQLHFHWESEHEFEGKRADLEMHLVHYNSKYGSFAEAVSRPDGVAVFAVLFDETADTNGLIENFFGYILASSALGPHPEHPPMPGNFFPELVDDDRESQELFALRDLLPRHTSRFFRYEGSLTTPGCGEVVQWTIFVNRFPVSSRVMEAFRNLRDHQGNFLTHNFRPPQNLNGREVFIQIVNYDGRPVLELGQLTQNSGSGNVLTSIYVFCGCLLVHLRFK